MLPLQAYLEHLHEACAGDRSGDVATYIPELAGVDPELFGICLVLVDGTSYEVGHTDHRFTIQSMSKPLTYAMALDELGAEAVGTRIGLEPTGDPFNAISLDPATGRATNAMVNAGAITAADLLHGLHGESARAHLVEGYSKFTGRALTIDDRVAESERTTGHRNRAIAHLLRGAGSMGADVEGSLDLYFQQCSVSVDCHDLGVIAATLANGGRNPITGQVAAGRSTVRHVLSVMSSCGMYNGAGRWIVSVGLPAKSGVSGGIIAVLPGQLGIAVFSPRLDEQGNSVRGVAVCRQLCDELDLHLVGSGRQLGNRLPAVRTLADGGSARRRSDDDVRRLGELGDSVVAIELRGDVDFADAEWAVRQLVDARAASGAPYVIVDVRRADVVHRSLARMLGPVIRELDQAGGALVLSGVHDDAVEADIPQLTAEVGPVEIVATLDDALEWCEDRLLAASTG